MISAQKAEIDATIQNCIDVSPRTLPKDVASDQSIDNKEFLDNENSESQHHFSVCSSVLGGMELTNPCTANLETISSPAFEPIEVHSQHYTENYADTCSSIQVMEFNYRKANLLKHSNEPLILDF